MVAVFFMKSDLIQTVPLETGATVNISWYVNTCDTSSQPCLNEEKREAFEVSFFTMIMQSHKTGLGLPMNFCWKIMSNNMKMQRILQTEVLATSFRFRN